MYFLYFILNFYCISTVFPTRHPHVDHVCEVLSVARYDAPPELHVDPALPSGCICLHSEERVDTKLCIL